MKKTSADILERWYSAIEMLVESKQVGMIYHFTSYGSLRAITSDFTDLNPILLSSDEDSELSPISEYTRFVAATRNYNLQFRRHSKNIIKSVRFALDGNRLSQNFKIHPINYASSVFYKTGKLIDGPVVTRHKDVDPAKLALKGSVLPNEYEERIWMTDRQMGLSLKKYCTEVSILLSTSDFTSRDHTQILAVVDYFKKFNIPVKIVTSFKPYGTGASIDLTQSNFKDLNVQVPDSKNADFWNANLQHVNFENMDLEGADFWNADLQYANLRYANLKSADLWYANLKEADLQGANLQDVNLRRSNLQNTNLKNANLQNTLFRGATLESVTGQNSSAKNVNFIRAKLRDVNFTRTDFENANFQRANLERINFTRTKLINANLRNTSMQDVDMQRANLLNTSLHGADLSGVKNLKSALNIGTVSYDLSTIWPEGFNIQNYK